MRCLIVYPNLHMMLVPSVAVGLFTKICDMEEVEVELFDTTHYEDPATDDSAVRRVESLQYREFDAENDLGFQAKPADDLIPDLLECVERFKPDLILMSVVEDTFSLAVKILEGVKDYRIPSLMGGVFPTAAPKKCIDRSLVDAVCVGEGESVVHAVLKRFKSGRTDFGGLPRVWTRDLIGNACAPSSTDKDSLEDINRIVPTFRLFDIERFNRPMGGRVFRTLPLETFRGCPFKCTFCNSPMQVSSSKELGLGHFLRRKKINEVKKIIEELVDIYDAKYIYFVDDSFLSRPKDEIFDFIKLYEEFRLPFWFNTRPESCEPEVLEALKEVGLDRLSVGLEHGNEKFRREVLLRKPTNKTLLKYLGQIADSDIAFSVNTMIGFPGESRDMAFDTIEFCRELRGFDAMTVSIFTPYHGTKLRDQAIDDGYLDEHVMTKHTTSSSILNMPNFTRDQIDGLFRTFMMYVRFERERFEEIRKAEYLTDEGNLAWKALYNEYQSRFFGENQDVGKELNNPRRGDATIDQNGVAKFYSNDWEEVFGDNSKSYSR